MVKLSGEGSKVFLQSEETEGRYVYCVAESDERIQLGRGIDACEVYTVPFDDLCAVVHKSPLQPYVSADKAVVESWVIAHDKIVGEAWNRLGTVVPVTFNTIVKGRDEDVAKWLSGSRERLRSLLEKFKDREEYGVQIYVDAHILREMVSGDEDVKDLAERIEEKPQGIAYFHKHRLEEAIRSKIEEKTNMLYQELYSAVKSCADDIHVEKVKESDKDRKMIANFSLLVKRENIDRLKLLLTQIEREKRASIRFTGPWPPYSFVG